MAKRDFFTTAVQVDYGAWTLKLDAAGSAFTANRSLALDVGNADRTIALAGNLTIANNLTTAGNFPITLNASAITSLNLPSSGTLAVTGSNTFTGNQSINTAGSTGTGSLIFGGSTMNWIDFGIIGVAPPSFTTRSIGTKVVLNNGISGTAADYALGIDASTFWSSVPVTTAAFKWYGGTTLAATLSGLGALTLVSTVTASNLSGTNTGDQTAISGNAGTATALQTARLINGVSFNGTADITISAAAAASALTGTTLAANVVASSLTSVGTLTSGTWNASIIGPTYGGTGVNNGGSTITLAGPLSTSGAFAVVLTMTAATNVTLPTTGTLATLNGSEIFTNKGIIGGTHTGITNLGIRSSGTGPVDLTINNTENLTLARTLTLRVLDANRVLALAGDVTFTAGFQTPGGNAITLATIGVTNITLPTVGTLATLAGAETLTNKTLTQPFINGLVGGTSVSIGNTASTLILRDPGGSFAAGTATLTGLNVTGGTTNFNAISAGLEIGGLAISNSPYIDFHSSTTSNDYDVRLIANPSTGATVGLGSFSIIAAGGTAFSAGVSATTAVFSNTLSLNLTTANPSSSIVITNTGTNGVQITMTGNGATTPNKTIRLLGGALEVINSAYTLATHRFLDNGDLQIAGSLSGAAAALSGTGTFGTYATIGGGTSLFYSDGTNSAVRATVTGGAVYFQDAGINTNAYISTGGFVITTPSSPTSPQIYLNSSTSNWINWANVGVGPPTFTTRSAGTKLVLYTSISATAGDYAFGIDSSTLWSSVPTTGQVFKWYAGTTTAATLTGTGDFQLPGTIYCSATDAIRLRSGNTTPTALFRNDGSNFYILLTDAATPDGTFNSFRPLSINTSTGNTYVTNLYVSGSVSTNGNNNSTGYTYASTYLYADKSVIPRATPSTDWGIDFTQGNSGGGAVSFAQGATYDLAVGSGIVILHDNEHGGIGVFQCWAGIASLIPGGYSGFNTSLAPSAGTVGLAYNSATNRYRITNNVGSTQTIWISTIRTRPSS
jgi:hypothetical protein